MSDALLGRLRIDVFVVDFQQVLNEVGALARQRKWSNRKAFFRFKELELLYESKDWTGKNLLPLQVNLLAVIELLKQQD
jgi:hypothetical protein